MKYKKYRVFAEGTVEISGANAKDIKESTFLMVEGLSIRAKITVKPVDSVKTPSKMTGT